MAQQAHCPGLMHKYMNTLDQGDTCPPRPSQHQIMQPGHSQPRCPSWAGGHRTHGAKAGNCNIHSGRGVGGLRHDFTSHEVSHRETHTSCPPPGVGAKETMTCQHRAGIAGGGEGWGRARVWQMGTRSELGQRSLVLCGTVGRPQLTVTQRMSCGLTEGAPCLLQEVLPLKGSPHPDWSAHPGCPS